MPFVKYQHLERVNTDAVEGLLDGECFIFHKIDGTNGSVWLRDGKIKAGSRNRELTIENDNAGFYQMVLNNEKLKKYLEKYPEHRLFGEFLVPHTFKQYEDSAWRRFYIFDVGIVKDDETIEYLPYDNYKQKLEEFGLDYVPPIASITNPNEESLTRALDKATFLVKDGAGAGEGIVIKNYGYTNKYGKQIWGKIVSNEFKSNHTKEMGCPQIVVGQSIEGKIVEKYCTDAFIEKEYAKIVNEQNGWSSKFIPMLLGRIFSELVKEETWNILKQYKNPTINFRTLNNLVVTKVKTVKSDVF